MADMGSSSCGECGQDLERRPMSGWRSIDDAPKDGTEILVWSERDARFAVAAWTVCNRDRGSVWSGWEDYGGHTMEPTHWMPLPATPGNGT